MELWIFPILTCLRSTCTALTGEGWGLMVVLVNIVPDPTEEPVDCYVTIQLCWFRGRIMLLGVIQAFTISSHNYLCHKISECVSQSSCVSRHTCLHLLQVMIALVYYFWAFLKWIILSVLHMFCLHLSFCCLKTLQSPFSLGERKRTLGNWEFPLLSTSILPELNPNSVNLQC